ncbi:MAG TPA: ABC transporter ATP-binding protein [Streptosporangiaceae bacterium]|jgi:iron(III) transport system ATP-binding protein
MTRLTVTGLGKSFPGAEVLRGVDLRVEPGAQAAILGASGAGKTTLLRIIAGFEAADAGTVSIGDDVMEDGRRRVPPERRRIGFVPQDGALFPHLTVRANAAFSLPRRDRRGPRVTEILDLVGLAGLAHRYPHELSGGQQQRVAIARALASEPRLVLLDEPFASLDAALRAQVRAEVLGVLRTAGTTAVLVTHDQDEALSSADHVVVLRDGAVTQAGSPREVYECPADPWTASFVGTANLLPGTLQDGAVRTSFGTHRLRAPVAASGDGHPPDGSGRKAPRPASPGQVTVLIRPEQISLAPPVPGTAAALVTGCRYHGHDALLTLRPGDSPGPTPLHVRVSRPDPPQPGEQVGLHVHGDVVAWHATHRPANLAAHPAGPSSAG